MNKIYICLLLVLLFSGMTLAQECGPACPVCSGAGANSGALLSKGSILFSGLSIPTADEERTVLNTRIGVLGWLDAGIGYAVRTEKVLWNVRIQPVMEKADGWKPGIILGTGSVQIGGSDQSVYAQVIKSLAISKALSLQFSTGVATLVPDFDETYGQAGITTGFNERYFAFANYDGKSFHQGVSWMASNWFTLSFLMVESEYPAISVVLKY